MLAGFLGELMVVDGPPAANAQDMAVSAAGSELLNRPVQLQPESETAAELKRILAQEEFQSQGQKPRESWLQRSWNRLQEMLGSSNIGGSGVWGVVLAVLLLALIVFLVVRLAWQFATRAKRDEKAAEKTDPRSHSMEQLIAAANEAAARGDYREALRFRYLALLRVLNLPAATVLTNSQIKRRIGRIHPALKGPFGQLVTTFEDTWYGGMRCLQRDYAQAEILARGIEKQLVEQTADESAE